MSIFFNFNHLKSQIAYYLAITLIIPFLIWTNPTLSNTVKQAEKLFFEKFYEDAHFFYSSLLNLVLEPHLKEQLMLRLATCCLEEGESQTAIDLLVSLKPSFCHYQWLYLISLAYRQQGNFSQALNMLQQCSLPNTHPAKNLIRLEQGYHFTQIGDLKSAEHIFKSISWQITHPLPYFLAQIQLSKIFLRKQQFDKALQILFNLSHQLPSQHLLNIERVYLSGWTLLAQQKYFQAAIYFEELLPKALASTADWGIQVLNGLIMSYLKQALSTNQTDSIALESLFSKTDHILKELLKRQSNETSYLLLTDFYLIKAKCLHEPYYYIHAQHILEQQDLFSSQEGLQHALLKRAAADSSYEKRSQFYEQLALSPDYPSEFCSKVWFFKGINDFEEGLKFQRQQKFTQQNKEPFQHAIKAFKMAIQQKQTAEATKYLALAYAHLPETHNVQQAWQIINGLIENNYLLSTCNCPEEIYCLCAWLALRLKDHDILKKTRSLLHDKQAKTKCAVLWQERYLKLEGLICLQLGEWQQADRLFMRLLQNESYASSRGEAYFWLAYSADQQGNLSLKKNYLQQAYTQDPQSNYAPIAYFQLYSYREYIQGKRKAIKHLQTMPLLFSKHPLLMNAYYLIGLNYKKNYLSEEGKIVQRRDWTAAIDAFQLVESTFDSLLQKNLIPLNDLLYFIQLRYQAQLERAQANLAIAQHSNGGKKRIYLEYAEEVFKQLIQDFTNPQTLAKKILTQSLSPYPKVWAEAELQLANTYEEKNEWDEAEFTLNTSLEHYRQAQITHDYGLMRVWYAKGKLAQRQIKNEAALKCFLEAEKAVYEHLGLSPNEKLDLWIQQSLCYKALNQLDQAMQLLSKVINDDVISPLRIKAMFLRTEVYELQGRPELAIKQLKAIACKEGEWAQKAKVKLERIYEY